MVNLVRVANMCCLEDNKTSSFFFSNINNKNCDFENIMDDNGERKISGMQFIISHYVTNTYLDTSSWRHSRK